jgi:hypothetical protein
MMGRTKIIPFALGAAGVLMATVLLFFFAPERYPFYPRCPFHLLTGWQCPGCGGLRAAHRLLHGDVAGAFHYNPLLVLLGPLFAVWFTTYVVHEATGKRTWYPFTRPAWGWSLLAIAVLFGVARNIVP